MSKLKVLVAGCAYAVGGYPEHTRVILDALRSIESKIDLTLLPYRWSNTSNTYENEYDTKWYDYLVSKFDQNMLGHFDISIQLGVPSEWKRFAKYNIGVTAGVETTTIPPEWIDHINGVDKVITVSNFAKNAMINTKVENKKIEKVIDVIGFPIKQDLETVPLTLNIDTKFNFLCVTQWAPRKNLEFMLKMFVETFKNSPDVGLILKTYTQSNSIQDYCDAKLKLFDLLPSINDRKCKVYLIHGDMTDVEMNSLYKLDSVKAYVNTASGEGWCIPMFQAAYNGIPIVAPDFSGYKDYLYQNREDRPGKFKLRPFFQKVSCDINPVQQHQLMPGIINPGMLWSFPQPLDFKFKLQEVYKDYGRFKKQAIELQKIVLEKYDPSIIYEQILRSVFEKFTLEDQVDEVIEVT